MFCYYNIFTLCKVFVFGVKHVFHFYAFNKTSGTSSSIEKLFAQLKQKTEPGFKMNRTAKAFENIQR